MLAENYDGEPSAPNSANQNVDADQLDLVPWDIGIEKTVINLEQNGSAVTAPFNISDGLSTATYRLDISNNGPARNDIAVQDIFV